MRVYPGVFISSSLLGQVPLLSSLPPPPPLPSQRQGRTLVELLLAYLRPAPRRHLRGIGPPEQRVSRGERKRRLKLGRDYSSPGPFCDRVRGVGVQFFRLLLHVPVACAASFWSCLVVFCPLSLSTKKKGKNSMGTSKGFTIASLSQSLHQRLFRPSFLLTGWIFQPSVCCLAAPLA